MNVPNIFCKMVDEQVYGLQKFWGCIKVIFYTDWCLKKCCSDIGNSPDTWEKLGIFKFGLTVLFYLPLKRETKAPQITAEDRLKRNEWWFNFYNLFFLSETCLGMLGLHENPLQLLKKNVMGEWGIIFSVTVCYKTSKTSFFFSLLHCFLFVNISSSFSLPVKETIARFMCIYPAPVFVHY